MESGYYVVQLQGRWTYIGHVELVGLAWVKLTNAVMLQRWGNGNGGQHTGFGSLAKGPHPNTRMWGMGGREVVIPVGSVDWLTSMPAEVWEPICTALQHRSHEGPL